MSAAPPPLSLRRLDADAPSFEREFAALIAFEAGQDAAVDAAVADIVADIRMLTGVNVEATVRLARELKVPVIASGGIASIADIELLLPYEKEGIMGAIAGRALYEGRLEFKAALKAAKG